MRGEIRALQWYKGELLILDQRALPGTEKWIHARNAETVAKAIEGLAVRGAPVIGIAAAYGVALEALRFEGNMSSVRKAIKRLKRTRPTGFNLHHVLAEMTDFVERGESNASDLLKMAKQFHREDADACLKMARHGALLIKRGERILTYCNTGALATGGIGTALGVIKRGYQDGRVAEVFACETRPVGQGARLTVWECVRSRIPVTLICDNMVAALMSRGAIDRVFVGADRVTRNGDASNKIGTLQLAILAKQYGIPFHVVAPFTTFDPMIRNGNQITIEERRSAEVTAWIKGLSRMKGFAVWNPAFDVTPAKLITSFVTEQGVIKPPFFHS